MLRKVLPFSQPALSFLELNFLFPPLHPFLDVFYLFYVCDVPLSVDVAREMLSPSGMIGPSYPYDFTILAHFPSDFPPLELKKFDAFPLSKEFFG